MAVYTVLERAEIERFIEPFGIGPLVDFEGVAAGIENTNYFITTDQSEFGSEIATEPLHHYVLTLFEEISANDLAFYVELTTLLSLRGLPVPCPARDADGQALQTLHGKPALLVPRVKGEHPKQVNTAQCRAIGNTLAGIHKVTLASGFDHPGNRSLTWLTQLAEKIKTTISDTDRDLLAEVERFNTLIKTAPNLPRAIIHGDLFRDNTLFQGDALTAIIDFNSAGSGFLMMDLAITVNDWCSEADGSINDKRCEALLAGYQQTRPLEDQEKTLWNDFLRIAAARFWLSRLATQAQLNGKHRPGNLVEPKDPKHYKTILMQRIHNPYLLN